MAKASKVAYVTINGNRERVASEGTALDPGGETREPLIGANSHNFTAKPRNAELTCDLIHTSGMSLLYYNNLDEASVEVEYDTGDVWLIAGAWTTGEATLEDGMIKNLKIQGPPAEEDLSS